MSALEPSVKKESPDLRGKEPTQEHHLFMHVWPPGTCRWKPLGRNQFCFPHLTLPSSDRGTPAHSTRGTHSPTVPCRAPTTDRTRTITLLVRRWGLGECSVGTSITSSSQSQWPLFSLLILVGSAVPSLTRAPPPLQTLGEQPP